MGDKSMIEWTDATWNPTRGCSRVSEGCRHCYAERQAARMRGPGGAYEGLVRTHPSGEPRWTGEVRLVPEALGLPLRWKRPRRVFVDSMSDLFHEDVPDQFIDWVFAVMALARRHTFQVLTKRPERMAQYLDRLAYCELEARGGNGAWRYLLRIYDERTGFTRSHHVEYGAWPLPNVWLGTSCENQSTADERIPLLLQCPAAVRFVSAEPLLAALDLSKWLKGDKSNEGNCRAGASDSDPRREDGAVANRRDVRHQAGHRVGDSPAEELGPPAVTANRISWIIIGGESGPGARPCDVEWIRSAVRQCREAGTACFVKQLGALPYQSEFVLLDWPMGVVPGGAVPGMSSGRYVKLLSKKGSDQSEWPEDLRVRELPETINQGGGANE